MEEMEGKKKIDLEKYNKDKNNDNDDDDDEEEEEGGGGGGGGLKKMTRKKRMMGGGIGANESMAQFSHNSNYPSLSMSGTPGGGGGAHVNSSRADDLSLQVNATTPSYFSKLHSHSHLPVATTPGGTANSLTPHRCHCNDVVVVTTPNSRMPTHTRTHTHTHSHSHSQSKSQSHLLHHTYHKSGEESVVLSNASASANAANNNHHQHHANNTDNARPLTPKVLPLTQENLDTYSKSIQFKKPEIQDVLWEQIHFWFAKSQPQPFLVQKRNAV
ncbi:hypothetical protein RFI_31305 [Reticulomyxa filosa]|uniref:Uncharacterized protein n=1 Tax=Reticulomyxa filosa TaxID=46433 RepID=X6LXJ5_RETFI|nr:hypothetical protein RFI_31305 [Reticulomyxa filosa]|eukprot:ETO06091.1 hypothetical protein RFI_31305 [Reticulomyxa filosa]